MFLGCVNPSSSCCFYIQLRNSKKYLLIDTSKLISIGNSNEFPPVFLHSKDNQFSAFLFTLKDSACQYKKCGKVKEYSFDQALDTVPQCHGQQVDVRIIIIHIHIICLYICPSVPQRDSCNQRVSDGIYGNN